MTPFMTAWQGESLVVTSAQVIELVWSVKLLGIQVREMETELRCRVPSRPDVSNCQGGVASDAAINMSVPALTIILLQRGMRGTRRSLLLVHFWRMLHQTFGLHHF